MKRTFEQQQQQQQQEQQHEQHESPRTVLEVLLKAKSLRQHHDKVLEIVAGFAECPFEPVMQAWEAVVNTAGTWGPLPAAPALAWLPNGAVQPEVHAHFDVLLAEADAADDAASLDAVARFEKGGLWHMLLYRKDWKNILLMAVYGQPKGTRAGLCIRQQIYCLHASTALRGSSNSTFAQKCSLTKVFTARRLSAAKHHSPWCRCEEVSLPWHCSGAEGSMSPARGARWVLRWVGCGLGEAHG